MSKHLAASVLCLAACIGAASAQTVQSGRIGHPGESVHVTTAGFRAETVDIFFDTKPVLRGAANGAYSITVPADAQPGTHWITALAHKSGDGAQAMLNVNSDWPELGFSPRGTRNNWHENTLTPANVSALALAWQTTVDNWASSPVVANGLLYIGTRDGHVLALDAVTGVQRWSAATAASIMSTPAVSDGTVYVTSNDRKLYAFDAATGALRWASVTDATINASPVAANGLVYVTADSGTLFAFKARNGILAWEAAHDFLSPGSTPAAAGGMVYAMSDQDVVFGFDGASGALKWVSGHVTVGHAVGSPAIMDGVVYISSDRGIGAFDALTGATLWSDGVGPGKGSLAAAKGAIYMGTEDHVLWNVDAKTGAIVRASFAASSMDCSPAVANGVLYIGDDSGTVSAYRAKSGKLLWSASTGIASIYAAPAVANGMLYTMSGNGSLLAYALNAGDDAAYKGNPEPASFAALH